MVWKRKQLNSLIFHSDRPLDKESKDKDERNMDSNEAYSIHSLPFIKWIGKISNVLDPKDTIKFQIKNDHPFRVDIQFKKLGDSYLLYFLAPRIDETEYEEDEELEDF